MDPGSHCVAIIPCFNEEQGIGAVVAGVRRQMPAVIVVDDGSTDRTGEMARAAGAEVLRIPVNGGKGAALRRGWERAQQKGFAWGLTMDGDGQHAAEDIPALLAEAEKKDVALVIGNRMANAAAMPWLRRQVNRWLSRRISKLTSGAVADSQSGFRLVHLPSLSRIKLRTNHFEIESEMLVAFATAGFRVRFVPVSTIYTAGPSRIDPLVDGWRWWRWWRAEWKLRRANAGVPAEQNGHSYSACAGR